MALGLAGLILSGPCFAQAVHVPPSAAVSPATDEPQFENPYRVVNVLVDRSAGNAAQARELAIQDGQRFAWRRLVERLMPQSARDEHLRLPAQRVGELFEYFEVQRERISGTRYMAILTIVFKPEQVRTQLSRTDLPTASEVARREREQRDREEPSPDRPPVSRLTARLPVNSMGDLIQVRQRLGDIQIVRRADQISLTRTEAIFELHYVGDETVLTEALRQQNLGLTRAPEGWALSIGATSVSAQPQGQPAAPGAAPQAPQPANPRTVAPVAPAPAAARPSPDRQTRTPNPSQ